MVVPYCCVHIDDEPRHVLFLFEIHAGHRLVEQQQVRLHRQRPAELDALLQTIRQAADRNFADGGDFKKIDDLLDAAAMLDLLAHRRPIAQYLPEKSPPHLQRPPGKNVVKRGHAAKQRQILEGAGDAARGRRMRPHAFPHLPFEGDAAGVRLVEAVDDVEHGGFAGAIGADNGADLAFADVERDASERADAAERK